MCPDGRKLRVAAVTVEGKDLAPATKGETAAVQKIECGGQGRAKLVLAGGAAIELMSYPGVVAEHGPKCRK